jgi:putative ABC transport system substrate-binding protein
MKRRTFIAALGSAAVWPTRGRGQGSAKVPRIGVLWPNPLTTFEFLRQGLAERGYVDGQNIKFELRVSPAPTERLIELARELVAIPVDVLVTLAPQATVAARNATQTIPIVFVAIGDPIASGLVPSIAHPGANLTGTTRMLSEMSATLS